MSLKLDEWGKVACPYCDIDLEPYEGASKRDNLRLYGCMGCQRDFWVEEEGDDLHP
jgi:DNA-directed RNA polymerase subunit RPC12/RpoP